MRILSKKSEYRYWNKGRELASPDELKRIQLKEVQAMLKRCYDKVQHFHKKYDAIKLKPEDVKTLDDLKKVPLTLKTDLRDNYPFGLFAAPMNEIIRIHASSGTTGKPTVVGYTRHDIDDVWTECMARTCVCGGLFKGDIVQNAYGYGLFTGGLGFHYGAERIGAAVIPISGGNTERQIMLIQDFGSTAITCTPSYAIYLAEMLEQMKIPREQIKLHTGIFGAEFWTEKMREKIEEKLHVRAIDIYGLSEMCGPGVSVDCIDQQGLHIWSDHFLPEIVDRETHESVAPGEKGDLIFSTITKEGIPLPRYDTRDQTSLNFEKCSCGRWHPRHSKILGRSDDMMKIKGINVFPSQIESVLLKIPGLGEYYEIVVGREGVLENLKVRIELTPQVFSDKMKDIENFRRTVEKELFNVLQINCQVELVAPGAIPRSMSKAKRVIDLRKEGM